MAQIITVAGVPYLVDDAGVAHPVEATAAPVAPVAREAYVSPFARLTGPAASRNRWDGVPALAAAAAAAPDGDRTHAVREAAAWESVPLYSCTAPVGEWQANGETRTVGHGFATPRKSGDACPTNGCKGTIR